MSEHEAEPEAAEPTEPVADEPDVDEPDVDEPDDDEAADEAEHEHEAEQQASSNAIVKALEREENRHRKAIAKALALDEAELHECPTCEAMGYTPEPIASFPELVQDPFTETCERCRGNGATLSGATPRGLYEIPCQGCGGVGYVQKVEHPEAGAAPGNGARAGTEAPPQYFPVAVDPRVAELRAQGYTIVDPVVPSTEPVG